MKQTYFMLVLAGILFGLMFAIALDIVRNPAPSVSRDYLQNVQLK